LPILVYRNNAKELNFKLAEVLAPLLLVCVEFAVLGGTLLCVLRKWIDQKLLVALASAVLFLTWLQAAFLQWDYGSLEDGTWYRQWRYGGYDGLL
jgi:fatty acid desaturase